MVSANMHFLETKENAKILLHNKRKERKGNVINETKKEKSGSETVNLGRCKKKKRGILVSGLD